jgi:hypothetical protein
MKTWMLVIFLALFTAHGSIIVHPGLPELDKILWTFVPGYQMQVGDIALCRDAEKTPWFTMQILSVEEDHSIMGMKPIKDGVSIMVQVPFSEIVDVARQR